MTNGQLTGITATKTKSPTLHYDEQDLMKKLAPWKKDVIAISGKTGNRIEGLLGAAKRIEFTKKIKRLTSEFEKLLPASTDAWVEVRSVNLKKASDDSEIIKKLTDLSKDAPELYETGVYRDRKGKTISNFKENATSLLECCIGEVNIKKSYELLDKLDKIGKLFQNGGFSEVVSLNINPDDDPYNATFLAGITLDKNMIAFCLYWDDY